MLNRQYLLKIMHNNLMPLFLANGLIFLQTGNFSHLSTSETNFSHNYIPDQHLTCWDYLHSILLAEKYAAPKRRPAQG
jgi:hypothetical protein